MFKCKAVIISIIDKPTSTTFQVLFVICEFFYPISGKKYDYFARFVFYYLVSGSTIDTMKSKHR